MSVALKASELQRRIRVSHRIFEPERLLSEQHENKHCKSNLVSIPEITLKQLTEIYRSKPKTTRIQSCAICRSKFGQKPCLITSCSHMFHSNCLKSVEYFTKTKYPRCPLCRKQNYKTFDFRLVNDEFLQNCVILLQSTYRMFFCCLQSIRSHECSTDKVKHLRRFRQAQWKHEQDRKKRRLKHLLEECDEAIAVCKKSVQESKFNLENNDGFWPLIKKEFIDRADYSCPICLYHLDDRKTTLTLLSCSHCLHATCYQSYLSYCDQESVSCPTCRTSNVITRSLTL